MKWLRACLIRLRNLFRKELMDRELNEELASHLEMHVADNLRRGMSPEQARRDALIKLGGIEQTKETYRDRRGWPLVEMLMQDVGFGWSMLRKSPGFTAVAVFTLALGIGGTVAIFSAVNPILFESLPYPHAKRLMMIWEVRDDGSRNAASFGMYRGLLERQHSFATLALIKPWTPTMTGTGQPERLVGQRVSASYFQTLGVPPILGREFETSEDRLHSPNVVILSDSLWRRRFAADPTIAGRQIVLDESAEFSDSNSYTVVGVMPVGFENVLAPTVELWAPLQYDLSQGRAWGHHLRMVGRLEPDASAEQATRELNALGQTVLAEEHPETYGAKVKFTVTSLQDDVTRMVKPALLAVFAAVLLVLVIACVNVTNLVLARGVQRRREFALRAALGAGRSRLVRQLLTESLLLSAMGGLFGMAIAILGVRVLVALSPPELPRIAAVNVNGAVFVFALGITTLIGLAFGLTPALHAAGSDPQMDVQHGARHTVHRRTRSTLVVVEVALALVLLVCSGLLLRSLTRLFAVPPGFNASHLLTMQVEEVGQRYGDDNARYSFFAEALEAVQRVPGVAAAAFTSQLPLSGDSDRYGVSFERDNNPALAEDTFRYAVTPGYLETVGIPLRRGRFLDEHDRAGAPLVALINESFARRKFGAQDPIGERIHIGPPEGWYTIVGVVGDVRQMSLALSESDAVYITTTQWHEADTVMSLVVRVRGDAAALAPAITAAIWSVDKDQPVVRVATMEDLLADSAAQRRFALILFEAFALAALLLAAAGIYGMLCESVAERTREIGVRAALGASQGGIVALVVRQGMVLAGCGVAIGLVGAAVVSQAITAMLFGVSPIDPLTYLGVIALLGGVAILCVRRTGLACRAR